MNCPVCHSLDEQHVDLHVDGFNEGIYECKHCGASWSVNHNRTAMINDPQEAAFLAAIAEPVEEAESFQAA